MAALGQVAGQLAARSPPRIERYCDVSWAAGWIGGWIAVRTPRCTTAARTLYLTHFLVAVHVVGRRSHLHRRPATPAPR